MIDGRRRQRGRRVRPRRRAEEEVADQRLARCVRESSLPAHEFVGRWVPAEFFVDASGELQEEMVAVVSEFHPLGFRLMAQALADSDTTELLPRIDVPTLLLWGESDRRSPLDVAQRRSSAYPRPSRSRPAAASTIAGRDCPARTAESAARCLIGYQNQTIEPQRATCR